MKDELDRFYTNIDVATVCVQEFINVYPASKQLPIVEPSAGSGSFVDSLRANGFSNIVAFDISPSADEIIQANFLSVSSDDCSHATVFVGNPPFGERSIIRFRAGKPKVLTLG